MKKLTIINAQKFHVKMETDEYDHTMLLTSRNGYQWSGTAVEDKEAAKMIIKVLIKHFNLDVKIN